MIPDPLARSPYATRLACAIAAVRSAGAALMQLRGTVTGIEAAGGQLKTHADLAAEGWILGFLEGSFPGEPILAEERFERAGAAWPGARAYWTVDALDGTRSFVEGFAGFCVQIAYVDEGEPRVGVIGEPVSGAVYAAVRGGGAWRLHADGTRQLRGSHMTTLERGARFVDSTRPGGPVGALFDRLAGAFVECGSVGLKICRVVEDAADIYAKKFTYKLWDVAPGEVLLREVGGVLGTWDGTRVDYAGARTHYPTLLAAPAPLYPALVAELEA